MSVISFTLTGVKWYYFFRNKIRRRYKNRSSARDSSTDFYVFAIDKMLSKHKNVTIIMARGNHDSDTAIALALILKVLLHTREKGQLYLDPHGFFHTLQFGKNLLAIHHGDKVKAEKLGAILPKMLPEQWSSYSVYRKWIVGHIHHQNSYRDMINGCFVEAMGTLSPLLILGIQELGTVRPA
jgi:hypothetical protein